MEKRFDKVLASINYRAPATDAAVKAFCDWAGPVRDSQYLDFMRLHDGGEGPIGAQGYLILWPLLETIENTEGYEVEQVQKGLLLFATDGGDTAYAFDRVDPDWAVVEVSLSSASPEDVEFYARNFAEFVVRLARENGLFDLMAGPA